MGERNARGVEAAGDVGVVDEWEELFVRAAGPVAVCLTEVDVDEGFVLDGGHCGSRGGIWHVLGSARNSSKGDMVTKPRRSLSGGKEKYSLRQLFPYSHGKQ